MASREWRPDLSGMYEHRWTSAPIRDAAPAYGPRGTDRFPADDVLTDLRAAGGTLATLRMQRILARYAALRCWLLRVEGAPPSLTRHAADAARLHLAASAEGGRRWSEGEVLRRLLDSDPGAAAPLLSAAGNEAARAGDVAGAAALRSAAGRATRLRLRGEGPGEPG
jgi:hypothetical protein